MYFRFFKKVKIFKNTKKQPFNYELTIIKGLFWKIGNLTVYIDQALPSVSVCKSPQPIYSPGTGK